jgi:DNA-binding MurR/RpiR family transcriptional regulator
LEEKDSRIANKALSHPDIPDGPGNYLLTFEDKLLYKRFLLRNFIPHCVLNALNLQLKRKIFPLAVNLLDKARRIEFYGSGGSGMVAMDAHHKFFRLAVPCIAYQNSHMQVMSAALLSSDCVVIAISATGSTKDVIDSTRVAKKSGARTIGITGREKSPLGRICDCNLPVYSQETAIWLAPMSTRILQLALLDVLFVSVAMKKFNGARKNLGKVKQTLIEKHY